MKLTSVTFEGYRRFLNKTTLKTNSKLTVLIGPNEAGKSSILRMLSGLNVGGEFAPHERYKFKDDVEISIKAEFHLDKDDHDAIDSSVPAKYILEKDDEGGLTHHIHPKIHRAVSHRLDFKKQLAKCIDGKLFKECCKLEGIDYDILWDQATNLPIDPETIPPEKMIFLDEVVQVCRNISGSKVPKYISDLPRKIEAFKATELRPHPNGIALEKIESRLPKIVEFTEKDRELNTTFNMLLFEHETPEQRQEPCAALVNLCSISGLDLYALKRNLAENKPDRITKQFDNANLKLRAIFEDAWSQSDISIHLAWHKPNIEIMVQIRGGEGLEYNLIEDRSDGFRQYVALLAFIIKEDAQKPILLIDEAELHLHYDAQADLVQTFTERNLTSQVIYTTHSAGCLPEDLGVGVKLVVPQNAGTDFATSHIENNFWTSDTLGFSPILYGMGAKTLAFFPTRKAVVTEGQTEMLLMPTIFRQVSNEDFNGFQIVPGLAGASKDELGQFALQGQKVGYLVDNDPAGKEYSKQLQKAGVPKDAIFFVNAASTSIATVEDWISDDVFAQAVERYRLRYFSDKPTFDDGYFIGDKKAAKLEKYQKDNNASISKTVLAYIILEIAEDDLSRGIFNPKHKGRILKLRSNLISLFE